MTMTHYLLSVHVAKSAAHPEMTKEEMQESYKEVQAIEREMKSAGAWVFGGRLHDPDTATVVRVSGKDVLTTDGPFAESHSNRLPAGVPNSGGNLRAVRPSRLVM